MVVRTREIYHSANGDRWSLAVDSDTDRVFVRHEPNLPAGGQVADIEIGAFTTRAQRSEMRKPMLVSRCAYVPGIILAVGAWSNSRGRSDERDLPQRPSPASRATSP